MKVSSWDWELLDDQARFVTQGLLMPGLDNTRLFMCLTAGAFIGFVPRMQLLTCWTNLLQPPLIRETSFGTTRRLSG